MRAHSATNHFALPGLRAKAGGIPPDDRFSELLSIKNTVNQLTMELETGAPPKKQTLMGLFSTSFSSYVWTARRSSDFTGLDPALLRMQSSGLQGTLDRTKVSGPRKHGRSVPIFVTNWHSSWCQTGSRKGGQSGACLCDVLQGSLLLTVAERVFDGGPASHG